MGPKSAFFQNVHFRGPNWVGGAWYGIFSIREKPARSEGLINLSKEWQKELDFVQLWECLKKDELCTIFGGAGGRDRNIFVLTLSNLYHSRCNNDGYFLNKEENIQFCNENKVKSGLKSLKGFHSSATKTLIFFQILVFGMSISVVMHLKLIYHQI